MVFIGGKNMEIQTTETVDIVKLEETLKWCKYRPNHFLSNLNEERCVILAQDILIIKNIQNLYSLLHITPEHKGNRQFIIGKISFEDYERLKLIRKKIELFNIEEEARLKLTETELNACTELKNLISFENIYEIERINNFYVRSYTRYLIFNNSDSKLHEHIEKLNQTSKQELLVDEKKIYWKGFIEYK